jgi:carbon-monoxide dehydrogenase large subunit
MKRVEDPRLIKGIGTYVDDIKLPGLLHAASSRAPTSTRRAEPCRAPRRFPI